MAKSLIPKLPLYPFIFSAVKRVIEVLKTPDTPVKKLEDYPANKLANSLHPAKQHLKVVKIVKWSEDMKTYVFAPDEAAGTTSLAWFSAGSYLSITYRDKNISFTRPYSISSAPRKSLENHYCITVKRTEAPTASNYILDNWIVGTKCVASDPQGEFTYEPLRDAKRVIGIAGGSGITPFRSMAYAIADGDEDFELTILYGSRTLKDAVFSDELKALSETCPKIKLINVLSEQRAKGCKYGFVTAKLIESVVPKGEEYSLFVCGPQAMYRYLDAEIEKLGIRPKFVRQELFGEYSHPENDPEYKGNIKGKYELTVKMAGKEYVVPCRADTTVLRALEEAGIDAPNRCRSGKCGWCHAQLLKGKVYTPKSVDGRRIGDIEYGYIHPCSCFPLGSITIDIPPMPQ
ncbi:MAG: iron-sulfur cluster-binding domain-containing protein [Clostridia bacterium]|nr:iron-sulfur cluster-binding domain-containing protein [Clostridia bacterium]